MDVAEAQREVRTTFLGGFMGQLVSGLLWLASASLATWGTPRQAILCLVVGGVFIYPATRLGLRLIGARDTVSPDNPLMGLGMQVALVLPLALPVVGGAALYRLEWFYPAFMIVLGAHYLPFVFLYGMKLFGLLAGVLIVGGVALGSFAQGSFAAGAWLTGATLLVFAALGRLAVR